MQRVFVLAAFVALLAWPGHAHAASDGLIDCDKAETRDEKTICASPRLIQEDARMVTMFKIATGFVGMGTRSDMQDAQVKWLEKRHSCGDDQLCLRDAYTARIAAIGKIIDAVTARGPF